MSLNFKLSFDQTDFIDEEFLKDLEHIYNFYNDAIELEYKANKEKINKPLGTLDELMMTIRGNNIQFGNIILYNFNIPLLKRKFRQRNL